MDLESRYSNYLRSILKWRWTTDGRKFNGSHKEVLKTVMELAEEAFCPTVGEVIESSPAAEQPQDADFQGSVFSQPSPGVTLGCISPEARDLLDTIMAAWESHFKGLKETHGDHYDPTFYGFAYWLVRWSGLIQPATAKATPSGITWVRASERLPDDEDREYLVKWDGGHDGMTVAGINHLVKEGATIFWLDEAPSQGREVDAIAFAEWINNEPYLYGRADYGWFYDIPVEGAGVEHKLIGDTKDLYQLFIKQKQ